MPGINGIFSKAVPHGIICLKNVADHADTVDGAFQADGVKGRGKVQPSPRHHKQMGVFIRNQFGRLFAMHSLKARHRFKHVGIIKGIYEIGLQPGNPETVGCKLFSIFSDTADST